VIVSDTFADLPLNDLMRAGAWELGNTPCSISGIPDFVTFFTASLEDQLSQQRITQHDITISDPAQGQNESQPKPNIDHTIETKLPTPSSPKSRLRSVVRLTESAFVVEEEESVFRIELDILKLLNRSGQTQYLLI
jgi:hypothetical protein